MSANHDTGVWTVNICRLFVYKTITAGQCKTHFWMFEKVFEVFLKLLLLITTGSLVVSLSRSILQATTADFDVQTQHFKSNCHKRNHRNAQQLEGVLFVSSNCNDSCTTVKCLWEGCKLFVICVVHPVSTTNQILFGPRRMCTVWLQLQKLQSSCKYAKEHANVTLLKYE